MISKNTANAVLREVSNWATENDLELKQVADLFDRLAQVEGNQSFRDSIFGLKNMIWDKILGRRP